MSSTLQLDKLRRLLEIIEAGPEDSFYNQRLQKAGVRSSSLDSLDGFAASMPFTTKSELVNDHEEHPPFGSILTLPLSQYTRFCQTSGTSTGNPMAWVDTPDSWQSMLNCWKKVYEAAGIEPGVDRVFFAFSFGPFLGFWTAFEAATENMTIPGGGLSSTSRLSVMARYDATVLCCTPTYAMRLGQLLHEPGGSVLPEDIKINKIIVAGEPGGSITATRARISELWGGADVFDHHGMTEVGPVSYEHPEQRGNLVVIESAYFAEILDQTTGQEVPEGEVGELVLTTLDRSACPLLRYRTGDLVRKRIINGQLTLEGGILGRCDEMKVIRGVNIYPSAIDAILHEIPEVTEFQVIEKTDAEMEEIEIEVELAQGHADSSPTDLVSALESKLRDRFSIRIPVSTVDPGSLPRYEFKAKRWIKR